MILFPWSILFPENPVVRSDSKNGFEYQLKACLLIVKYSSEYISNNTVDGFVIFNLPLVAPGVTIYDNRLDPAINAVCRMLANSVNECWPVGNDTRL